MNGYLNTLNFQKVSGMQLLLTLAFYPRGSPLPYYIFLTHNLVIHAKHIIVYVLQQFIIFITTLKEARGGQLPLVLPPANRHCGKVNNLSVFKGTNTSQVRVIIFCRIDVSHLKYCNK